MTPTGDCSTQRPGFASDRQIIERVVIPAMMSAIVSIMMDQAQEVNGEDGLPVLGRALALLKEAMTEPVKGLPPDRIAKLIRRAKRLTEAAMRPHFSHPLGVQYLLIAYWTKDLVDRGVVSVGSESCFGMAWDLMAEVMVTAWDDLEKLENVAIQGAREMGDSLAAQGYFR
jgi:hypothetical protein